MEKHAAPAGGTLAVLAMLTACSPANPGTASPSSAEPAPSAANDPSSASTSAVPSASNGTTSIRITAGDRTIQATLNDSEVSQDFLASLPRTISASRNAG